MLMYIGSVFVFILFPLVFYFLYGEKVVAIELVFPFMDPTSDKSFYISTLYQIYGMVFACAAMSGLDGIFVLFTFQGLALIEATQASFHEFGCILNAGKSTKLEVIDASPGVATISFGSRVNNSTALDEILNLI